jgi:drug/metabolite transporter (DMT)-like permease
MSQKQFFLQLGIVSLATAVIIFLLNQHDKIQGHDALSWIGLVLFVGLSIAMYFMGRRSAASANKNDFTNTVLAFTLGKMFLALLIIFGYLQLEEPESKFFILPFFCVYLIYTIFETYFMMRLGRMNG